MSSQDPHLLVAVSGNVGEWRQTLEPSPEKPRLPLPYAFGAGLIRGGFRLSAVDLSKRARGGSMAGDFRPFQRIYGADELQEAIRDTDLALLWGRPAVWALARQAASLGTDRRLLHFSYVWQPRGTASVRQRIQAAITQQAARFARGLVLMTAEQQAAARCVLPRCVPVIPLTVGVDFAFYAHPAALADVGEHERARVERLLESPYVILPGDELRLNEDALAIVEASALNLVRISQYGHKNDMADLKAKVARRNLGGRLVVFERISYPALRFLMRNAAAYAGLVDSTWQPAGWTVACECLASGVPCVIYEGLVSRELARLGAGPDVVRSVPIRDTSAFVAELRSLVGEIRRDERMARARAFASEQLDQEGTGTIFADHLRQATRP
jgi:hypothetical protein